ncbi:MAG: hypothetical protein Kow00120_25750 [Anaerolineae bacterium]
MTPENKTVAWGSRFFHRLTKHWLRVIIVVLALYVGLPFAAPTLMRLGLEGPAHLIYTVYAPLCHQLAFRSLFLFGAQPVYPLAAAGVEGLGTFEAYATQDPAYLAVYTPYYEQAAANEAVVDPERTAHLSAARYYEGNPQMGYKVALCERDIAIYGALLIGALLFSRVRGRLRPAPFWLYFLLGIAPIGLDGFSQLLSDPQIGLWPLRESIPAFRLLTGALFGLMNVWLAFPYVEMTMREAEREMDRKAAQQAGVEAARARARERLQAWSEDVDAPRSDG